jgi:hypothetical protein
MRPLIYTLVFLFVTYAQAMNCSRLNDPELAANSSFWVELAELQAKSGSEVTDDVLEGLIEKHKVMQAKVASARPAQSVESSTAHVNALPTGKINETKDVIKFKKRVTSMANGRTLERKLDALYKLWQEKGAAAKHDMHGLPWRLHYIEEDLAFSVRLDLGYRALIKFEGNELKVLRIGNDIAGH